MKITRRTFELNVETSRRLLIRRRACITLPCEACRCEVLMSSPDDASSHSGLTPRALFRMFEAGRVHFSEDEKGQVLVCLRSLFRVIDDALTLDEHEDGGEYDDEI